MRTSGTTKGVSVPSLPLPENASLEHLKSQAKLLQDLIRSGDPGGLDLVEEFHPRIEDARSADLSRFKRTEAQLLVARLYGFVSWNELRTHLDLLAEVARPDPADGIQENPADRFVALACVSYAPGDVGGRIDEARSLLASEPGLAVASIAAMAVTGAHGPLADAIESDPGLIDRPCGPNDWPPILYCTYSRVEPAGAATSPGSERSTLSAARLLLEAGADPDAGFLWRGLVPPFTALTGALGGGELDQPRHRDGLALARLLLEAGADPNDGQALYNNGLAGSPIDDVDHLELLTEFGLGAAADGPWYRRFGSRLTPPAELLTDELEIAATRGLPRRMRFLLDHGLDADRPVGRSGQRPADLASHGGHTEVLAVLAEVGIVPMADDDNRGPVGDQP